MSDTSTGTLGKLVTLLELISVSQQPLRFVDVVKASKQPRGTVHRQLAHLLAEGLIEQLPDQTYVPGLRLLSFATKAWERNDLRSIARPYLAQLNELTGEAVHLDVLRGSEVTYLDKLEARQNLRMHSHIGNRSPAYCTGVGKAALSLLSDEEISNRLCNVEFYKFTPTTITTLETLLVNIAEIRERGFAYDLEEHEEGICCVAAPLVNLDNRQLAAISVTGPAYRVSQNILDRWGPMVTLAAKNISESMRSGLHPK